MYRQNCKVEYKKVCQNQIIIQWNTKSLKTIRIVLLYETRLKKVQCSELYFKISLENTAQ